MKMKVVGLKIRARNFSPATPTSLAHAREEVLVDLFYVLVSREEILTWILSYSGSSIFLPPDSPGNL